jgi:hypothetical protein
MDNNPQSPDLLQGFHERANANHVSSSALSLETRVGLFSPFHLDRLVGF